MSNDILEKNEREPLGEFKVWAKAFKEKLNSPPSYLPIESVSSETQPPNGMRKDRLVIKENPTNGFLHEVFTQAQELEARARVYAESYPQPPGKLSARVEQLENEIVELKNTIAAQNTVIQQLEQCLARLEAA